MESIDQNRVVIDAVHRKHPSTAVGEKETDDLKKKQRLSTLRRRAVFDRRFFWSASATSKRVYTYTL